MKINIALGALLSDLTGESNITLEIHAQTVTVSEITDIILEKYKHLEDKLKAIHLTHDSLKGSIFVIDGEIVRTDHVITKDTLLRILPPIAGG